MFEQLREVGFQLQFESHAEAILAVDFAEAADELQSVLVRVSVPVRELLAGGGGEAGITQRLRRELANIGWRKTTFVVEKRINSVPKESQSHEVDHVRTFESGLRLALEIEWNNKDPFFDRDLENFKRLHSDGAISMGIIVTRGRSLQEGLRRLIGQFLDQSRVTSIEEVRPLGYEPTPRQKGGLARRLTRLGNSRTFGDVFADAFVSDKFGEATTHWRKLEDRVRRGVGNPCPLVLIGLPVSIVTLAAQRNAYQRDSS